MRRLHFRYDQRKTQALTDNTPTRDRTGSEDDRETGELPGTNEVDITGPMVQLLLYLPEPPLRRANSMARYVLVHPALEVLR